MQLLIGAVAHCVLAHEAGVVSVVVPSLVLPDDYTAQSPSSRARMLIPHDLRVLGYECHGFVHTATTQRR